jgi:hypothetical protein
MIHTTASSTINNNLINRFGRSTFFLHYFTFGRQYDSSPVSTTTIASNQFGRRYTFILHYFTFGRQYDSQYSITVSLINNNSINRFGRSSFFVHYFTFGRWYDSQYSIINSQHYQQQLLQTNSSAVPLLSSTILHLVANMIHNTVSSSASSTTIRLFDSASQLFSSTILHSVATT